MIKRFFGIVSALIFVLLLAVLFLNKPLAATFNDYVTAGGNSKLSQSAFDPGPNSRYVFIQARRFDLSSLDFNEGSGVTNGTVLQLFDIPPNTYITEFGFRCTRCAMSGTSAIVGDEVDVDGYVKSEDQDSLRARVATFEDYLKSTAKFAGLAREYARRKKLDHYFGLKIPGLA